jgi:hypothetical protein
VFIQDVNWEGLRSGARIEQGYRCISIAGTPGKVRAARPRSPDLHRQQKTNQLANDVHKTQTADSVKRLEKLVPRRSASSAVSNTGMLGVR